MSIRTVKIAEKAVIWLSATILLYLFINVNSPICIVSFLPYLNINLSFLTVPVTVLFIFLFASSISPMFVKQSRWKDVVSKVFYGLAISAFIGMFFEWAPIPAFVTAILFPLELTVLVFTGSIVASSLLKHRKSYEPLLAALCTSIVAYAVYDTASILSQVYTSIVYIVLPFTVGLLTVGVSNLFGLLRHTDKFMISKISEWIYDGPIRNFTSSFFLTIYFCFVRPSIEVFPPTVIGEWIMIAIMVAVLLNAAKGSPRSFHVDSGFQSWKRHARQAQRQTGRDFKHLVSIQEKFVNHGIKEPLLVYLTLALRDVGEAEEDIFINLSPLIHYRDRKPSFWDLPWARRKLKKANMEARRNLLKSLVQKIEEKV